MTVERYPDGLVYPGDFRVDLCALYLLLFFFLLHTAPCVTEQFRMNEEKKRNEKFTVFIVFSDTVRITFSSVTRRVNKALYLSKCAHSKVCTFYLHTSRRIGMQQYAQG